MMKFDKIADSKWDVEKEVPENSLIPCHRLERKLCKNCRCFQKERARLTAQLYFIFEKTQQGISVFCKLHLLFASYLARMKFGLYFSLRISSVAGFPMLHNLHKHSSFLPNDHCKYHLPEIFFQEWHLCFNKWYNSIDFVVCVCTKVAQR
jgi:hypothetical protein